MTSTTPRIDLVTGRRRGTGLIAYDPRRSAGGYTLVAPQTDDGNVRLIAPDGTVAHHWKLAQRPGRHAVILPNGNLGYNGNHTDTPNLYPAWEMWHGGAFSEVTPDGQVVWSHEDKRHHHDAQWLADGDLLYTTAEVMPADAATRISGGSHAHDLAGGVQYADVVKRVDRSGATVWEWKSWEHLDPADYPIHPIFDRYHWPLINGLGMTRAGLVLMSLRTTSGVIGVDPGSGNVVWRIAHPVVAQQHSPVELPSGRILIFDNGNLRPGVTSPHSRVIEVEPMTQTVTWEYADPMRPSFFAPYMGNADRLENGNTLITESTFGRLFEVTPEGDVVWEYVIPQFAEYPAGAARDYSPGFHNSVFKANRYPKTRIPWL
ncbi:MAG: aryl-sulfate sulfotransferase [Candidatus Lustribacter sp.]